MNRLHTKQNLILVWMRFWITDASVLLLGWQRQPEGTAADQGSG